MANDKKCSDCDAFDPILHGMKETKMGWCAKRSIYPFMDSVGQVTPPGVKRVENATDPAQPYIVEASGIKQDCNLYAIKKKKKSKAELLAEATGAK